MGGVPKTNTGGSSDLKSNKMAKQQNSKTNLLTRARLQPPCEGVGWANKFHELSSGRWEFGIARLRWRHWSPVQEKNKKKGSRELNSTCADDGGDRAGTGQTVHLAKKAHTFLLFLKLQKISFFNSFLAILFCWLGPQWKNVHRGTNYAQFVLFCVCLFA